MTAARLISNPAEGHGLTSRVTDPLYHALANDEDTGETIACVVLLKPVGHGSRNTANGRKQFVQFEVARIEPVTEAHDAEQVRHLIQSAWDRRHTVQTLPLDWPNRNDEEQRRFLFGLIDEWAADESKTPGEVGEAWRTYYGIEPDAKDTPAGYAPVDYRKADAHKLREFCLSVGVLADDDVAGTSDDDALALDDPDDEAAAS
jgi:hypothetical protein